MKNKSVHRTSPQKTTLLLIGGGHAHLYILKKCQTVSWPKVDIILLCPSRYQYYSGMFSGFAEGLYHENDIRVDLAVLAEKGGVHWIQGHAIAIDPKKNVLTTNTGEFLHYDVCSFDIGSLSADHNIPGAQEKATFIKPIDKVTTVLNDLREKDPLVIVGGGASGVEMSLALQAWRVKNGFKTPVTLISSGRLLEQESLRISRKMERIVQQKGIQLLTHSPVQRVVEERVYTLKHDAIPFEKLLWLAGPQGHPLFKKSGLDVDARGFLLVTNSLQATQQTNIFGAGDCVTMQEHPNLAKAGVYAVRQANVLWQNLSNFLIRKELNTYTPQSTFLAILSTGHEQAFLIYKGLTFHGKWAWKLKRKIDTDFIKHYQ